jgi:hypothetical protein
LEIKIMKTPSKLRNTRETAQEFFGKSERWLWGNTAPRGAQIPCIRCGKSVLYDWDSIEQFLREEQGAVGPSANSR